MVFRITEGQPLRERSLIKTLTLQHIAPFHLEHDYVYVVNGTANAQQSESMIVDHLCMAVNLTSAVLLQEQLD